MTPDGRLVLIGGTLAATCESGTDCRGDGGLAKDAPIQRTEALTVAPNGSIYFIEQSGQTNGNHNYLRRIDPSGIISSVAGGGPEAGNPEAVPGVRVRGRERALDVAREDGTVLLADPAGAVIVELGTDGLMRRFAGVFHQAGSYLLDVDRRLARIGQPYAIAEGRDGSVYALVESDNFQFIRPRIVRIRPDGVAVRAMGFGARTPVPRRPPSSRAPSIAAGLEAGGVLPSTARAACCSAMARRTGPVASSRRSRPRPREASRSRPRTAARCGSSMPPAVTCRRSTG